MTSTCDDNGSSETTLADAFTALLFGKDSSGRSDFKVETLDGTGEPRHCLEHEVEATLSVNGPPTDAAQGLTRGANKPSRHRY